MNDLFYTPGWLRKAAEERWARERESEIRRVEEKMQAEASFAGQWMDGSTSDQRDMLLEREDYYRKRLAARPKPRKKKPRKEKQPLPTRLLPICLLPECEYTRERRIFAPPNNRLSRDAQHRSWDGYEWAII